MMVLQLNKPRFTHHISHTWLDQLCESILQIILRKEGISMTHLQIERMNMLINKALAEETVRSHKATEDIERNKNYETMRHNVAGEAFNYANLAEVSRHNRAGEVVSAETLMENTRHNVASESLTRSSQMETIRHDKATESEQHRTNVANEQIRQKQNELTEARNMWEEQVAYAKNRIAQEGNDLTRRKLEQDLIKITNDYELGERNIKNQLKIARMNNMVAREGQLISAWTTLANGSGKNIYYWVKALDDGTKTFVPGRNNRR